MQYAEQLAAEKSRAEAILASMSDGVVTVDPSGRVMLINPAAEVLTGVLFETAVGQPWRDALGIRDAAGSSLDDAHCPLLTALRDRGAR